MKFLDGSMCDHLKYDPIGYLLSPNLDDSALLTRSYDIIRLEIFNRFGNHAFQHLISVSRIVVERYEFLHLG